MITEFINWFEGKEPATQSAIISAMVTLTIFLIGGILKVFYEKYSFSYKMKKEFYFKQRIKIKEVLSLTKTPLIKSAEELNYRLWNLSNHIDEKWHNIEKALWQDKKKYYLRSFTYRFLSFFYWIFKAEESIYTLDFTQADKDDALYLKYIKTLKHLFCERVLLEELDYKASDFGNHFYKDELFKFYSYLEKDGKFITYEMFEEKFQNDYSSIEEMIVYITNIKNDPKNLNYNAVKCFHLFLIVFLNKYGLDYHHTSKKQFETLIKDKYSDIQIRKGYYSFLLRNKVSQQARPIIKLLELKKTLPNSRLKLRTIFQLTKRRS